MSKKSDWRQNKRKFVIAFNRDTSDDSESDEADEETVKSKLPRKSHSAPPTSPLKTAQSKKYSTCGELLYGFLHANSIK